MNPSACAGIIQMKKGKEVKISYWAAHATTIVSVTLVLLIIGIIALVTTSARQETRRLKESLEISVIMADSITNPQAAATLKSLERQPFCRNLRLITREQALEAWKADTGEDLEAVFGVNPLSPEISFTMPAEWSNPDSLRRIEKTLLAVPGVEEVAVPGGDLVATMNSNIGKMSMILGIIAVVMLVISFVLINNTVHLTIYARRFIIHTMQLVGATNGFIRRPVVWRNCFAGIIAGIVASGLLGATIALAPQAGFTDITNIITWPIFGVTALCLIILGGGICALTASIATTRYLRKDYSELFH